MSILHKLACGQNRRDEFPNQELARELVTGRDHAGIQELVTNLDNPDPAVQSDCIKTLYEVGYLEPGLITNYVQEFLRLLKHKNNRMVWGVMITLSTIASLSADMIFPHWEEIKNAMDSGSVITRDNGVKTLALVAAAQPEYNLAIFPFLLEHLATCRPKDLPQHSEKTLPAVNSGNKADFIRLLLERLDLLKAGEVTRIRKVIRTAEKR